jgi:hypothetical protein
MQGEMLLLSVYVTKCIALPISISDAAIVLILALTHLGKLLLTQKSTQSELESRLAEIAEMAKAARDKAASLSLMNTRR